MFWPEALYTTRTPMQTMMASTPVRGPSNPRARNVRPPAVRVRRVRDGENSSNIMLRSSSSMIVEAAQDAGQQRPDQRADDGREPAAEGGDGIPRGAVHPEKHELIAGQQRKYGQRLRQDGEHPQAQTQMSCPGRHQGQRQGVLSKHYAPNHIKRQSGCESQRQAAGSRRLDR